MPLFLVIDGNRIAVFDSIVAATGYTEPPEVEEGAYELLDAAGRRAELGIDGWDVRVEGWSEATDPDLLRALLKRFLEAIGEPSCPDTGVAETVAWAAPRIKEWDRKHTWPRAPNWLRRRDR